MTDAASRRWLVAAHRMFPLDRNVCAVREAVHGNTVALDAAVYAVLAECIGAATLDEHAARIAQRHPGAPPRDEIARTLDALAQAGLLVSEDARVATLGAAAAKRGAGVDRIVIRTCDRPKLFARLLASLTASERRHGTRHRIVALDDSRSEAAIHANRDAARASGLDMAVVDLRTPLALSQWLRERVSGGARAIDEIFRPGAAGEATYGRPLDIALLAGHGERLLMLDDDALLAPLASPDAERGVDIDGDADEWDFYAGREDLAARLRTLDALDPVGAHAQVLGASVGEVLGGAWKGERVDLGALDREGDARVRADSPVLFTQNAAAGDPGAFDYPTHFLELRGRSLAALVRDAAAYRERFVVRCNYRGRRRARIATGRPLTLTTAAGLDNRALLAPTVRALRNEDLLLGEVTMLLHPHAVMADLPWALPHFRDPERTWQPLAHAPPFAQDAVHVLIEEAASLAPALAGDDPQMRLAAWAAQVGALARASDEALERRLAGHMLDTVTRLAFALRRALDEETGAPATWRDDVAAYLRSATFDLAPSALATRTVPVPRARSVFAGYAEVLAAWPALRAAAQEEAPWSRLTPS